MKILLLVLAAGALVITGCSTGDSNKNNYSNYDTNSYDMGARDKDAPPGTPAVRPNPSNINPLDSQSDNSLLQK